MQKRAALDSRSAGRGPSIVRRVIRYIVDSVAHGQKYHLQVIFSDGSTYHSTRLGAPDVTLIFRKRSAEWRMVVGGMFEFLESYFDGDVDIVGEHGLRKLVISDVGNLSGASSTRSLSSRGASSSGGRTTGISCRRHYHRTSTSG